MLPENLRALAPKFLELTPGTRIVTNRYTIDGWDAEESVRLGGHSESYCTAHLYVVPARAGG